ncbi:NINE protein [Helicobacter equorum]|uniref:TM2 domain-containing protein n=1 Tax=Helicobacter equorum TaxID=361872 RepID=A0A3D8IN58_9HELI|nr:NINE protein [Helicobacter equorum]RDU66652.1 TM2 domain-containing protein [Helicobacter equorum]
MDTSVILMTLQDKIPSTSLPLVKEKLEKASEDQISSLAVLPLKSHIIGLVLGWSLGICGADRFYKGDIALGIAKLALFLVGCITIAIGIGGLLIFAALIWSFVDLFLVWKGIKQDNLDKILSVLS